MAALPYLASPGSIKTALERIRAAATPGRVTTDFITTKLQIKGGTGFAILPFLKKIGFVASDGSPTELYKKFRNSDTEGGAVADAIKIGYKELSDVNEYFYELDDKSLEGLINQVTGAEAKSSASKFTLSTLKVLRSFAKFDAANQAEIEEINKDTLLPVVEDNFPPRVRAGLNLSYTINLNLPATSDQAVFNAIFRSLKEHLLDE